MATSLPVALLVFGCGYPLKAWSLAWGRETWTRTPEASCGASAANEELGGEVPTEVKHAEKIIIVDIPVLGLVKGERKEREEYMFYKSVI